MRRRRPAPLRAGSALSSSRSGSICVGGRGRGSCGSSCNRSNRFPRFHFSFHPSLHSSFLTPGTAAEFQARVQAGEIEPELSAQFDGGDFGGEAPAEPVDTRSSLPIYAGVAAFFAAAVGGLAYWAHARNAAYEAWLSEDPARRRKYEAFQKKKATGAAD